MPRITPDSFRRRTRCRVAAGGEPDEPGQLDVRPVRVALEGTTLAGDGLVLAWLVFSASFTVAQARLPGRDPVAVTAVQFLAAALATGAFVNLEPLVGAAAGAVVFGDPVALAQAGEGAAILAGIALSSLPWCAPAGGAGAGGHPAGTCARWNVRWPSCCGPRRGQQ